MNDRNEWTGRWHEKSNTKHLSTFNNRQCSASLACPVEKDPVRVKFHLS